MTKYDILDMEACKKAVDKGYINLPLDYVVYILNHTIFKGYSNPKLDSICNVIK